MKCYTFLCSQSFVCQSVYKASLSSCCVTLWHFFLHSDFFFPHKIMYQFGGRLRIIFFIKLVFLSVHSSYWSCFHWIHVDLIYLNWGEMSTIKSLFCTKSIYSWVCIPYMHMAYFYTWYWIWQNLKGLCRAFTESSALCFWILCSAVFGSQKTDFLLLHWITSLFLKLLFTLLQAGRTFALLKYFSFGQSDIWNMNVVIFSKVRWLIHMLFNNHSF